MVTEGTFHKEANQLSLVHVSTYQLIWANFRENQMRTINLYESRKSRQSTVTHEMGQSAGLPRHLTTRVISNIFSSKKLLVRVTSHKHSLDSRDTTHICSGRQCKIKQVGRSHILFFLKRRSLESTPNKNVGQSAFDLYVSPC